MDFRLPVRAEDVRRVTLDGQPVTWKAEPGFGCTWLRLAGAEVQDGGGRDRDDGPGAAGRGRDRLEGNVGDEVRLTAPHGRDCWLAGFARRDRRGRIAGDDHHRPAGAETGTSRGAGRAFRSATCRGSRSSRFM